MVEDYFFLANRISNLEKHVELLIARMDEIYSALQELNRDEEQL